MEEQNKERQFVFLLVFVLAGLLLAGRAFQLQVLSDSFRGRADAVAMSKVTHYPARGLIYDRNGKLLINNAPVYDLMVTYNQVKPGMDTTKFCQLLGITKEEFKLRLYKDFKRDKRFSRVKPFVFLDKISPAAFSLFQESMYEFPGFFAQVRNIRSYPVNHAAHMLGYIQEVTDADIKTANGTYVMGDYIGKSGIELAYEEELKGVKGVRFVLKDNLGRDVGSFQNGKRDTLPVSGLDLITTIDTELQAYAESLMVNKKGAVVAIEPKTGEILAFLSSPTYNPNLMVIDQNRGNNYAALAADKSQPLFNRAIMASYPPGSTFKASVGLIGMQMGAITAETGWPCGGYYVNGGRDVRKCRGHAHPSNIGIALQWSCNSYFFRTFKQIVDHYGYYNSAQGLDTMAYYLHQLGFGQKLGVDFPGEKPGRVPDSKYYNKMYPKEKGGWRSPTIISVGIGQGEIELTTIQMANIAAIIANRGYYYIPHFVKAFKQGDKTLKPREPYRKRIKVPIGSYYFPSVVDGMAAVIAHGTAGSSKIPDLPVAGKTGTVQNPHGEDHSTFIGFGPVDDPKIAIAVYVENAGGGGKFAAPISTLLMEKYLRGSISESRKRREKQMMEANLIEPKPKKVFVRPAGTPDSLQMDNTPVDAPVEEVLDEGEN
ncbi:MAG: penicillin-binding protein 2 [Saprospiraceae bacterium]|jgi:penicillin-binding protein 2|nr:penicillin-binding protein 2 [Saprospiraceae bacterium]